MTAHTKAELREAVLQVLASAKRPLLAREIAQLVSEAGGPNVDKKAINKLLYGPELRSKVTQDKSYRWQLSSRAAKVEGRKPPGSRQARKKVERTGDWRLFSDFTSYYLDCLAEDEGLKFRSFLTDEGKTFLDLPVASEWSLLDQREIALSLDGEKSKFAGQLRQRGRSSAIHYGYPLYVDWISRSKSGWSGGFAIPVFTLPVEHEQHSGQLTVSLNPDWPHVNPSFSDKAFSSAEERKGFLGQLGLLEPEGDSPELELAEIVWRMLQIHAVPAPVMESLDPERLSTRPPIQELNQPGLYNRAVLVIGEKSKYTAGLEQELEQLRDRVPDEELESSSLRCFFAPSDNPAQPESADVQAGTYVEVVALNDEQREAVASSLAKPLTVVTGPPGTGKSQVVTNVLANAYLRGERVLFTSRNHKAVDVVESRVNGLASLPLVVRTGRMSGDRNLQAELLQFLSQALSTSVSDEDKRAESEARDEVQEQEERRRDVWSQLDRSQSARNELDRIDRDLEPKRKRVSNEVWETLWTTEDSPPAGLIDEAIPLVDLHLQSDLGLLARLRRFLRRRSDMIRLREIGRGLLDHQELLGGLPELDPSPNNLRKWEEALDIASDRLRILAQIRLYKEAFQKVTECQTPSQLAEDLAATEDSLWDASAQLIAARGKLLPDRLKDPSLRKALGEFKATVQRLSEDQLGGKVYADLRRQQEKLFRQVSEVLPVWCVTNLSARGSLPFNAGLFDLVVIDEASQCDIPSALPLFYRAKRAVVIGDPNQLRHISTLDKHREQLLQSRHGLVSAADQPFTFTNNSLFDLVATHAAGGKVISLKEHFRSHADIVSFSNKQWYQGRLRVCTDYRRLKSVHDQKPGVRWTPVRGEARRPSSGGALNVIEAEAVIKELEHLLLHREFKGSVGVVTPFRAQANRLRDMANDRLELSTIESSGLIVDTAHGFQGDERDVILFSPCVAIEMPRGAKYFLSSTGNLFNVAITRARTLLHVVGDLRACATCGISHVEGFANHVCDLQAMDASQAAGEPDWSDPSIGYWEKPFFDALVAAGLSPMPQYKLNQYRLDLAVVSKDLKLDVEVDGEYFHKDWDGTRARSDVVRDLRVTSLGWKVKRFWVYEIRDEMERCVQEVVELVNDSASAATD